MATINKQQAAALYAAAFNRAPDQSGFDFWTNHEVNDFSEITAAFVASEVFQSVHGEQTTAELVNSIYQNLFRRDADETGLAYWTAVADNAGVDVFLASIIDTVLSYEGDDEQTLADQNVLNNIVYVAEYYVETMGEGSNLEGPNDTTSQAYQNGVAAIADVDGSEESVSNAVNAIDKMEGEGGGGEITGDLKEYLEALQAKAAADKAETALASEINEELDLEVEEEDNEEFVAELTKAVDDLVDELDKAILNTEDVDGNPIIGNTDGVKVNATTIALIEDSLANQLSVEQTKLAGLKSTNKSAVALQEKIEAYNSVAKGIVENVEDFTSALRGMEAYKVAKASPLTYSDGYELELTIVDTSSLDSENALKKAGVKTVELTLTSKGAVDFKFGYGDDSAAEAAEAADETTQKQKEAAFKELKGAKALVENFENLHGNVKAQANAQTAIENAALKALKDNGYKLYDDSGNVVAWNEVKWAVDAGAATLVNNDSDGTSLGSGFELRNGTSADDITGLNSAVFFEIGEVDTPPTTATAGDGGVLLGGSVKATLDVGELVNGTYDGAGAFANTAVGKAAVESADIVKNVQDLKDAQEQFAKDLDAYNEAKEAQDALKAAAEEVEAAAEGVEEAEADLAEIGYAVVQVEDGVAEGTEYDEEDADQLTDLFLLSADLETVENFDGEDLFFFNLEHDYTFVELGSKSEMADSDNNAWEIFALQNGEDVTLYVETKVFGGAATGDDDLQEITLVGVQLADLHFQDGFLQFTA